MKYEISDLELIKNSHAGDASAFEQILSRYKSLAIKIARKYFLAGQDTDDLYQEAMIGLFKAYQSFKLNNDNSHEASEFKPFAILCINRQIQTAVKTANRQKNKALNEYISLNNQGGIDLKQDDEDDETFFYIIPSNEQLPDDQLISQERIMEIKKEIISRLSQFEKRVLSLYLKGLTYKQMSATLDKEEKSIENCLTRIKNKLSFLKK